MPCQRLIFLGAVLDLTTMILSLPQLKVTTIVDACIIAFLKGVAQ